MRTPTSVPTNPQNIIPEPRGWAVWFAVSLLLGLVEVGWSISRLPVWFVAYSVVVGLTVPLGQLVMSLAHSGRPFWQRVLLQGGGFWMAISITLFGPKLLPNGGTDPTEAGVHFGTWMLGALLFGVVAALLDPFKDR